MMISLLHREEKVSQADVRRERDTELEGIASLGYHERLTEFIRGSTRHPVADSITVVDFRPLYAVTVHNLQRRLAQELQLTSISLTTDLQLERIRKLIEEYSMPVLLLSIAFGVR